MTKRNHHARPLVFRQWTDKYTLGIFCQLAGLVDYARSHSRNLRVPGNVKSSFDAGIEDAEGCSIADFGFELKCLRDGCCLGKRAFDKFVRMKCGDKVAGEILDAVKDAHDLETDEMVNSGMSLVAGLFQATGRQRTREKSIPFAEGYHVELSGVAV